ncbi:MAG: zinc ribbon domain-containing protein [Candidatus Hermodarchaeota archaeon]
MVSFVYPYLNHQSKMRFKIKFDKILKINLNSNDNTLSFTFLNENYAECLNELNPSRKEEMEQKQLDEPSITQKSIMDSEKDKTFSEENLKDKPDHDIEKSLKEDLKFEKKVFNIEDVPMYPEKKIESFIVCPKCKTKIKSEMTFCFNCGTPLKKS